MWVFKNKHENFSLRKSGKNNGRIPEKGMNFLENRQKSGKMDILGPLFKKKRKIRSPSLLLTFSYPIFV
jgi:hypothetical protein